MKTITQIMQHKQNPLTGDWLCWIPETPQAYYYATKKSAERFCNKVNTAFSKGELIIKNGIVTTHQKP